MNGFNRCRLSASNGMSSHAADLILCVIYCKSETDGNCFVCVLTDEPQLMLTAGPSTMVYGAQPGMYGTYPPSGMPGAYGVPMQ